jgi:multicomponent Na+:H+ antiporter subunit F
MNELGATILAWTLPAVMAIMAIAAAMGVVRLIRGPSMPDHVVALDLIGTIVVGGIAVYAIRVGQPVYIYASLVLGLVLFLGTVAIGYYLERKVTR